MVAFSEPPTASPDVIKLAAPLLFGPVFNWALYGVLCVQICAKPVPPNLVYSTHPRSDVYSYNFPMDGRSIKFIAYFVFLLDTIQTALTGADIYYWFVAGFGNVERLETSHFTPIDIAVITAVISFIVQGYFCYRIWVLNSRSSWICWIIAVAAVTQLLAAMWEGAKSLTVENHVISKTGVYLWAISSALADILIAVAMTLLLRRASGNFSNFVLLRVVRLTVETNALTATLAIVTLVLFAVFPNELYLVYTYSNTLLVSLNNRIYLRGHKSFEHGGNTFPPVPVPDEARAATMTPHHFATPSPQPRALVGVISPRSITPWPVELDKSGNNTSTDYPPVLSGPWARRSVLMAKKTRNMEYHEPSVWLSQSGLDLDFGYF
ncbi:hypothetical protein H4582DRAFT_2061377 [Lactarius indigo]|nr:hypothetical protein H4582DRAFT_2061377 [Lactarius indigo]